MKAILMAAGMGSRISSEIGLTPKSMLEVEGQTILLHTVELLQKNGIEVIVITGYQHRIIEEALAPYSVRIYYNPFYRVTNSMGSLWYAREEFRAEKSVLLANADVYYSQDVLDIVLHHPENNFLLEDKKRVEDGDYFFLSKGGCLQKYGKELSLEERTAEYVGIGCVKNEWVKLFYDRLCELVENGEYNLWWENVLYSYVGEKEIHTVDVNGAFWSEVDTIRDYHRVLQYFKKL